MKKNKTSPLKRGSICVKLSVTGQAKVAFNTGDRMGRFDCTVIYH